jgi:hypothetical protein
VTQEFLICHKCRKHLPIENFRFLNIKQGKRASRCRDCRREDERERKAAKRQTTIKTFCREMRRTESMEKMASLFDAICEQLGGPQKVADEWIRLINHEDTPDGSRVKSIDTLVHISKVFEKTRIADAIEQNPVQIALEWHKNMQLVPLVRAFLEDGIITLDDIDPPPEEWKPK